MRVAAILVAAGRGVRAGGGLPKQFRLLAGQSVLARAAAPFLAHPSLRAMVVVHPPDAGAEARAALWSDAAALLVAGGESRAASVRAGLAVLDDDIEAVLIHDAARPLVTAALIGRVVAALEAGHAGAAPGLAVSDALWRGEAGRVAATQPRAGIFRAQTPQGFRLAPFRAAHGAHASGEAADDVEIARAAGLDVVIVEGDERNIKITTPGDFALAARLLGESAMDVRSGTGFDVHRLGPGDRVTLCGVTIPHEAALVGHSDADVAWHALADALYGALGTGDIGTHFPPSEARWKGAESRVFLAHAAGCAAEAGWRISSADLTLIAEAPRIGPHVALMRESTARCLGIEPGRVGVKATTSEGLGFTGRGEGIAAMAVVTLVAP